MAAYGGLASRIADGDRERQALKLAGTVARGVETLARDAIAEPARRAALEPAARDLGLTIFDAGAEPLVPRDPGHAANPRIRRVLATGMPHDEASRGAGATLVVYRAPVRDERGAIVGAVEVRRDVERAASPTMLVVGAVALLAALALGVALYARRAIGGPLGGLLHGIDRVIDGDLGAALPIGRPDEVGQLAFRFNEMTARLRDAQAELHRSEQRLRHSERLATVGQLAAGIAHEIGTPLGVIAGRARNASRKAEDPTEVQKNAEIIAEQAERIKGIIQQLLDFSRRGAGAREPRDLNATLQTTLAFVEHQIARAHVQLDVQADAALPAVRANGDELQQVCLNLVLNALDAMPRGGRLLVRTGRDRRRKDGLELAPPIDYAVLEVSDTGVGIAPEHRAHIFEAFFSTKKGAGTGLGLTVSQGIAKDHDGWIEVEERTGGGTTFRVLLPVAS